MSIKRIQNEVAASRFTLPVVCFVSALVWFALSAETTTTGAECSRYWNWLSRRFASNWMLGNAFMLLLNYLCVYLIMELNNRYNIIRTRTHMASAVFVLLASCSVFLHSVQPYAVVAVLLLLFYHCLFPTYQQYNAVGWIFNAFMVYGVALLFFPPLLYLFPFLLVAMFLLQSLTLRTFFAMLIGIIAPFWFVGAYEIVFGDAYALAEMFTGLFVKPDFDYSVIDRYQWICLGVIAFELIISWAHYLHNIFFDKIKTRVLFAILMTNVFAMLVFIGLYPIYFNVWFAVLLLNASPMIAHNMALNSSKICVYLFYISIIIVLLMATYSIWKPLLNSF